MLRIKRNTFLIFLKVSITIISAKSSQTELDLLLRKEDLILGRLKQLEWRLDGLIYNNCEQRISGSMSNTVPPLVVAAVVATQCEPTCLNEGIRSFGFGSTVKDKNLLCTVGHWVVIMQRFGGSVDFHTQNWETYKNGFGEIDANKEFFMGLEKLHALMNLKKHQTWELRIDLEDFDGIRLVAYYDNFKIDNEKNAFKLRSLGSYSGDAGDSFSYHVGQGFSTLDRDNDAQIIGSCSEDFKSAGWFKACMETNLFGNYFRGKNDKILEGMYWETFGGPEHRLKNVKMSIRERSTLL